MSYMLLAGAPILWGVAHKETCNFDKPLNHILKVKDGCMHIFCLVNIKTHIITMMELQPSLFFTDSLHEA